VVRPPHIRDVAALAGVGVGTVSRVLNESAGVADGTRERVRAAMHELGYHPSHAARRLSLGRTQTLGVIAPFFTHPSVVERVRGIDDVVGDSAYDLVLFNVETSGQREDGLRRFARADRVDGVLVVSLPLSDDELTALQDQGIPVVLVDVDDERLPHVSNDDVLGGALAARHLLDAGHRRVAFVGDTVESLFGFTSSARRLEGFAAALEEAGAPLAPQYIRRGPHGREVAGRLASELLGLDERPTAIFAASDVQAFGALDAAARAGLDVPRGVSVIGFDDIELAGAIGLTTVRQPLRESGRCGARLLLAALAGAGGEDATALPELVVASRRTVGAPP
jgi:LacI family transcriptional regulator